MEARRFRIFGTACAGGLLAAGALISALRLPIESAARWIPLKCPLLFVTGIHCPTCGLGRSLLSAAAGDWRASWDFHPLGIPLLLSVCLGLLGTWFFPAPLSAGWRKLPPLLARRPVLLWSLVFFYTLWGLGRHLP